MKNLISLITSILIILIATLHPFNFLLIDGLSIQIIIASFNNASFFQDIVNNILLFIPLGFSFTASLKKTNVKLVSKFLTVAILSASLSLIVEVLQIFLPSRTPTPADVANNTIGGVLGMVCFYLWDLQSLLYIVSSIKNSKFSNSAKKIALFFSGYILLSFLILIPCQYATSLGNWNLNYPLLIGNERTGDRPWQGYITEVRIADKAIPENSILQLFDPKNNLDTISDSLVASYQFTDRNRYQDRTGQLPELLLQGQLLSIENRKGVALSSSHWLKTGSPATFLSKKLRRTSQFTIVTTVATTDRTQMGPARIISLSSSTLRRNLTLGQQKTNLDLRIRTPITGINATDIKVSIPNIFVDNNFHQIVVTYSKGIIRVYVDKLQNSYSVNLLELIAKEQKVFYYALVFIPLGLCLTFLTIIAKRKLNFYRLLLPSGILLPSIIVESLLVINTGKSISLTNILIGISFTGGTMLIIRLRASVSLKKVAIK
jgi:glycopeptide antibiotics resistance protein